MINANMVKELRDQTGSGMMDCKRALIACDGNIESAIEWLRKEGLSSAGKKADRVAAEGLVVICSENNKAVILELNSETDFVGKNEQFVKFANTLALEAFKANVSNEVEMQDILIENRKVSELISQHIAVIGENIKLRRLANLTVENGVVATYMHNAITANGGKIGVIVALESNGDREKLNALGKQIAMHIAAAKPHALNIESLDKELIVKEREIFTEQAKKTNKPEAVIEKMVEGRIRKFYEEVVLLEQIFMLDGKTKISHLIEESAKNIGAPVKIHGFVRFALGEGIEKRSND